MSVVVAAPFAVGGVHRGTMIAFMLAAGVALALLAIGAIVDRRPLRVGWVAVLPAVLVVIPALQSVPLPLGLRGVLDPAGNAFLTDALLSHVAWPMSLDPPATRAFLGKAAAALAVFLCAFHLASGQTRRHVMPRAIAAAGVAAVVLGLGHRIFGFTSIYGVFSTAPRSLLVGPFVNPNHNAEFLELGAFACLACAFQKSSALNRYAWLTGMLFCAAGAIATFSRAAVFAVFVGMAVFTILRIFRRDGSETENRRASLGWSLLLIGLVGMVALILGAGALIERFHENSITADLRVRLWSDGWKVLKAHPFGIGRGAFERVFPIYRTLIVPFPLRFSFVENHPYQLLIDTGWLGFAAIVAAAAFVARTVARRGRRDTVEAAMLGALVAVVVHSFTDFGLETLGVLLPFSAMLGTTLGRCHEGAAEPARSWRPRLAVGMAALGLIIGTGSLCLASSSNFDALLKTVHGVEQTRQVALNAQDIHPTDYFYVLSYANTLPLRGPAGVPSPRLHALNRALLRCPGCESVHVAVARNLWKMGRRGQAVIEWRTAVMLEPGLFRAALNELNATGATPEELAAIATFDPRKMIAVADYLSEQSRVKEALVVLDQADAMDAPRADSLVTRVRLMLQLGQVGAAQAALTEIHAAGILDPRVSVLDARVGLAVRGNAGAEDALASLDAAAARYPLDVDVQRQRLALVTQFEKWQVADRAVEGLKVALYHSSGQAVEAHLASARIQAHLRHWNQSFNEYRIALLSQPGDGQLWAEFGRVADDAGRYPIAREAYAEAAHVLPNDATIIASLRRLDKALNVARSGTSPGGPADSDHSSWKVTGSP